MTTDLNLTVKIMITDQFDRTLFTESGKYVTLPGGHVKWTDPNFNCALVREVNKEELPHCLEYCKNFTLVGVYTHLNYINVVYAADIVVFHKATSYAMSMLPLNLKWSSEIIGAFWRNIERDGNPSRYWLDAENHLERWVFSKEQVLAQITNDKRFTWTDFDYAFICLPDTFGYPISGSIERNLQGILEPPCYKPTVEYHPVGLRLAIDSPERKWA